MRVIMTNEKLIVWGIGTSRTMRVHWQLQELGIAYETRPIGPRSGETQEPAYQKINPKQKIPTLQHGDFNLSESFAITAYLRDITTDQEPHQQPHSAKDQAEYLEWVSFILMELDATSLRHQDLQAIYGDAPNANRSSGQYFTRMVNSINHRIPAEQGYLWGEAFSEIDILMTSCLTWAIAYKQAIPKNAQSYCERMTARPAYQEAFRLNYSTP